MSNKPVYHELEISSLREALANDEHRGGKPAQGTVGGPSRRWTCDRPFFRVMNIRPEDPRWSERDRFIFPKACLHRAVCGDGTARSSSSGRTREPLIGRIPAAGSSGCHKISRVCMLRRGRSVRGYRLAWALPWVRGCVARSFIPLSCWDGELQGMVWEALHIAPRYKLGNLTAILDWNGLQQFVKFLPSMNSIGATAVTHGQGLIYEAYSKNLAGVASRSTGTTSRKLFRPWRTPNRRAIRTANATTMPSLTPSKARSALHGR